MNRSIAHVLIAAVGLLLLVGCNESQEDLTKQGLEKMKELTAVLKTVKDEPSAQAAKPKLQAISADLKEIKAKSDKLPKPSAEEQKRLEEKYKPQFEPIMTELFGEAMRVGLDPTLGPILKDSMPQDEPSVPGMSVGSGK